MDNEISQEKCYVLMPYGAKGEYYRGVSEAEFIYENIIVPAVAKFAEITHRNIVADMSVQSHHTGPISKKILEDIARADICIVDITGSNPNVFFELGVRYSLRNKTTILLKQEKKDNVEDKIPFDIQGYRCLTYDVFKTKRSKDELCAFLVSSQEDYPKTDSLVFETFKDLEVLIPNTLSCSGEACDHVSWWDWWKHIKRQAEMLKTFYKPSAPDIHVILGISNGGLIVADLLGRLVFSDIPILSLWANRRSGSRVNFETNFGRSCYYFHNEYNKAIMNSLKETLFKNADENNKVGILLVDDLVYTSNTCLQAKEFLMNELKDYEGKYQIIFSPLYCRRSTDLTVEEIKDMLICNYIGENVDDYLKKLQSTKRKFPYEKDLD